MSELPGVFVGGCVSVTREILFRGKQIDAGSWIEGHFAMFAELTEDVPVIIEADRKKIVYKVQPETVGQFTELTDKNGKKIFEGDIIELSGVRFPVGFRLCSFCALHESNVQFFFNEQFYWNHKERKWEKPDHITVIGNIHDNPELLEGV